MEAALRSDLSSETELGEYEHRKIEGVHAFWWWRFAENVPLDALRAALRETGIRCVWQADWEHPYQVDVEAFVPQGAETHFTSAGLDWVIYWSHEDSITVGGEWLLNLVKRAWPEWADHLRTTHYPPSMA